VTRQTRISRKQRELAILAVLSVYNAPYVLYAHSKISKQAGFSDEQISEASRGIVPAGLTEEEVAAYTAALQIASSRGPLEGRPWDQAQKTLGREKIAGLAHLVSGFIYVALLTNIGDGKVPEKQ
jgi:4-carboxymuconolactone decarboxylase